MLIDLWLPKFNGLTGTIYQKFHFLQRILTEINLLHFLAYLGYRGGTVVKVLCYNS